jgi:3,4-dihydroxy-2-butanone 4-phosphate synthase
MAPQSTSADVSPIEEIIVEMRAGRMVVLVDEEDRENEGDIDPCCRARDALRRSTSWPVLAAA